MGTFLSEDPIQFRGGGNFYRYVQNNPTDFTDPSGLKTKVCCRFLRGLASLTLQNHCYISITNDDGTHTYGLHKDKHGGPGPERDEPTDRGGTCYDVSDATPCKERALANGFNGPPCMACGAGYDNLLLINSNTWVWEQLVHFGMTPPLIPDAPGYPAYPTGGGHK